MRTKHLKAVEHGDIRMVVYVWDDGDNCDSSGRGSWFIGDSEGQNESNYWKCVDMYYELYCRESALYV